MYSTFRRSVFSDKINMTSNSEADSNASDNNDEFEEASEIKETERINIREKLSTRSFEDLLKMKEEIGSKLYNDAVFGTCEKKPRKEYKRANKNRPREISSKVRNFKKELSSGVPTAKKILPRDPRFDPLCGQYEEKTFKSNYKFVNDIRQKELKQLEKELKSCTNIERKRTIKMLIQRMTNQIREQQKRDAEITKKREESMEIRKKLRNGEKPTFKKKSVKKLESLIEKYEELKKTNKLQKHIEKRAKKLSLREKRELKKQAL